MESTLLNSKEKKNILAISLILGFMFSMTFARFNNTDNNILGYFVIFGIYTFTLFSCMMIFLRYFSFKLGFDIRLKIPEFDRYWAMNYSRLSFRFKKFHHIPLYFISLAIYILSLGTIMFTSVWSYEYSKIRHRYLGTQQNLEDYYIMVSNLRYSKILFLSYVYFVLTGFIFKMLYNLTNDKIFLWFLGYTYWIAIVGLIPILGTVGFEVFFRHKFSWYSSMMIVFLGFITTFLFNSLGYTVFFFIFSTIVMIFVLFWTTLMRN